MTSPIRGLDPLHQVAEKHGAEKAMRLRAEYQPGVEAPFPESAEEAEWLARRETLVLTVLAARERGIVVASWTRGGAERSREARLSPAERDSCFQAAEEAGAWRLRALAAIEVGPGAVHLEHEAYEYHDVALDSLDLEAWAAPRHAIAVRARNGGDPAATRLLARAYGRVLADEVPDLPSISQVLQG